MDLFALSLHSMRLISTFILIGVLFQLFSKQVIFVDYLMNKSYIVAVFCENVSVPEKHCEGKCHLKKELEKDSQRQESNSQKSKTVSEVLFSLEDNSRLQLNTSFIREIFYTNNRCVSYEHFDAIFHPPII